jgi:hypothetical protein
MGNVWRSGVRGRLGLGLYVIGEWVRSSVGFFCEKAG